MNSYCNKSLITGKLYRVKTNHRYQDKILHFHNLNSLHNYCVLPGQFYNPKLHKYEWFTYDTIVLYLGAQVFNPDPGPDNNSCEPCLLDRFMYKGKDCYFLIDSDYIQVC